MALGRRAGGHASQISNNVFFPHKIFHEHNFSPWCMCLPELRKLNEDYTINRNNKSNARKMKNKKWKLDGPIYTNQYLIILFYHGMSDKIKI